MSVQHRIAEAADRAPTRRGLAFSRPLSASLVAVVVIAVVATAILLGPRDLFGIGAASPSPGTPTPIPSPSLPLGSQTVAPTASPSATVAPPTGIPTSAPTPSATPHGVLWTELDWSEGVISFPFVRSVYRGIAGHETDVDSVVSWGEGYVAVGEYSGHPWFFASDDGLHWTHTDTSPLLPPVVAPDGGSDEAWILHEMHVHVLADQLVAFGHGLNVSQPTSDPNATRVGKGFGPWISSDGSSWTQVVSPSWDEATADARLTDSAAGPSGIVVVGDDYSDGTPLILFTSNGVAWERVALPSTDGLARFEDVVAIPDGFLIVGGRGEPARSEANPCCGRAVPGETLPAAWWSGDGRAWEPASVEGSLAASSVMEKVLVGADGLWAIGLGVADGQAGGAHTTWTSVDGHHWQVVRGGGFVPPRRPTLVSDGATMLLMGEGDPSATPVAWCHSWPNDRALAAWASTDGVTWAPVPFTGHATEVSPACEWPGVDNDRGYFHGAKDVAWLFDDTLIVSGDDQDQEFWIASATTGQ